MPCYLKYALLYFALMGQIYETAYFIQRLTLLSSTVRVVVEREFVFSLGRSAMMVVASIVARRFYWKAGAAANKV